jgi:ATP-dependent exoDNAse (exonuclease V) alpha subunit
MLGGDGRVANGTIANLEAVTGDGTMTIRTDDSRRIRLDSDYTQAGHVDHGYAITIHWAQGLTCDHVLDVGPAGLHRQGAYEAWSRARHSAHLYATTQQHAEVTERHVAGIPL